MLQIIWHSITRRWVQSLSTLLAVSVSVGILFALYLLYFGVSQGVETGKERLGADLLVVPAEARVDAESALFTGAPLNIYMEKGYEEKIAGIPGVRRATSQFFTQTLNEDCCSLAEARRLVGFDPGSDWLVNSLLENVPGGSLSADEILTGARLTGQPGGHVGILSEFFRIAGVLEPTGTSLDYSILMPIDSARRLAQNSAELEILWGKSGRPEGLISAVLVEVEENHKNEDVTKNIEELGALKVIQTSQVLQSVKSQMDVLFLIILAGGLLTAASSVLSLFSRFFTLAWDRKGEWGLYRALGATRRDLKLLVGGEALILTLGGVLVGLALGGLLYDQMLAFLQKQKAFPFIEPSSSAVLWGMAGTVLVFSLIGVLSAWFPARQGGKIEPSTAMALDDID